MQKLIRLFSNDEVSVADFECRVHPHGREGSSLEAAREWEVIFVRRGLFVLHTSADGKVVTPNTIVFLSPGESYRIEHPHSGGDDCTVFSIREEAIESVLGRSSRSRLFRSAPTLSPTATFLLHYAIWRQLTMNGDTTGIEEGIQRLFDLILREGSSDESAPDTPNSRSAIRRVLELLGSRFQETLPLSLLAREARMSPYHLSRRFRRQTGIGIHRYQNRLRLRAALDRISNGEKDLTSLALDLGYSSHSHFTSAFTAEYGMPPSLLRHWGLDSSNRGPEPAVRRQS